MPTTSDLERLRIRREDEPAKPSPFASGPPPVRVAGGGSKRAVLIFATLVVLFNLLADVLYGVLDPRIRYS